jgi:hypothetical protein
MWVAIYRVGNSDGIAYLYSKTSQGEGDLADGQVPAKLHCAAK